MGDAVNTGCGGAAFPDPVAGTGMGNKPARFKIEA